VSGPVDLGRNEIIRALCPEQREARRCRPPSSVDRSSHALKPVSRAADTVAVRPRFCSRPAWATKTWNAPFGVHRTDVAPR
jgi:hypothetical protein